MTDTPDIHSTAAAGGTTIEVGAVSRPKAPEQVKREARSASGKRLDDRAWDSFSLLAAAPALLAPVAWLIIAVLVALLAPSRKPAAKSTDGEGKEMPTTVRGSADLLVVPFQAFGRAGRRLARCLHPRAIVSGTFVVMLAVIAAIAVAALSGVVFHRFSGLGNDVLAARLAVLEHAPRLVAFFLTFVLIRRFREERRGRVERAVVRARAHSEGAVTAFTALVPVIIVLFLLVGPVAAWTPLSGGEALLRPLPATWRDEVRLRQLALATQETEAVLECIAERSPQYIAWQSPSVSLLENGRVWVAVPGVNEGSPVTPTDIVHAALALQNQLAPFVGELEVPFWRIDRNSLALGEVALDVDDLASETNPVPASLRASVIDEDLVVTCSAAHI